MVTGEDTTVPLVHEIGGGEVPAFHASSTPGGGPGMRGMHHAPPTQPPTPPTSQDIKQPPAHTPPQAHQMPPQSGTQVMPYAMPGTGRGGTQPTQFYPSARAPPNGQRMAPHARPSVVSTQSFMPPPVVQPVYQGHMLPSQMSGQAPLLVGPPMSQPFQYQQPRHQGGAFYHQQILLPQHTMFHYPSQTMFYGTVSPMSRASGPAPSSQGGAPAPAPTPMTLITGHGSTMIPNSGVSQQVKTVRSKRILDIIDPKDGRNVLDDMNNNDNTSSRSGESSARQTPQPPVSIIDPDTGRDVINDFKNENSTTKLQESCERTFPQPNAGQKTDQGVAAEFATQVVIACREDHSGSPNSRGLQQSSRTSNYSESESQASPDPQGMSTPSVSPSKLDTSVESISSENQIVENNIPYDTNQQAPMLRAGWTPMITGGSMPVEILPVSMHPGIMIADDMMRGGPLPSQPAREYQTVQPQWISDGNPVPVIISKEPAASIESPVRPTPERVTPVVSALAHGPTVDIVPRPQREHFPALGKGHQQPSPVKRKQRSEQTPEQLEGKPKDQQPKLVSQTKPKTITSTVENKKQPTQPTQPSQDSDEYVQSVQTKTNELKTIIIKKNDSDNSGTYAKSNDSLKNKESNYLETRNSNEEIVEDNNSINKSENTKCEVPVIKESTPESDFDEQSLKSATEEVREIVSPVPVPEKDVISAPSEDNVASNTNGETTEEDAKSNNQKSKPGNKRPAQSKMRLEPKDSRNAEPETPGIEVTPSAPAVPENKSSAPAAAVPSEQIEKAQEDATTNEEKEDLIVATKNEENAKQTTSIKANDATQAPVASNKVVLKHNYEAGQWSPLNPEGKKKYDRQFIIDLKNEPLSVRKPTNFPNLELLNDSTKQRPFDRNAINSLNRSHVDSLYPSFANKGSSQRGGQAITKRGSQQGKPKAAKPTVVQVSLQQDVKLHETENAWKPTRNTESCMKSEEEAKTEELYRRVRGILNKLTPEKFEVLVRQVKDLPIDNSTRLEGVIDLVFKKAVDEPSFSVAYAQMCSVLQKMEVPSDNVLATGKPEPENFRKLLIGRCQQEFEKNTAAELKRDERLQEIEQEKDPEKKKMLQLQFEEEERKIRMKSVGNTRFIGELYKMNMLTASIMHNCVNHLLNNGDEESLECLCKLLTTIGQGLENKEKTSKGSTENKKEEHSMYIYFRRLQQIVKNRGSGKVSSRVRFMIQDLIDLRNNKWVPRRNESQPKTIDQIQKEAERENMEKNIALNSHRESNKRQDFKNSIDNRKRGGIDSGGWTTIPASSQRNNSKSNFIECDKFKLDQCNVEDFSLGNRTQFIWTKGASSGKSEEKRSMSQLDSNKFALLSTGSLYSASKGTSDKDKMNSYKSVEDDVGSSKNSSQQDSRSSSRESVSSKREDRFYGTANKGSMPPSQPSTRANDLPEQKDLDLKKQAKIVLEDYIGCLDAQEATKEVMKTVPPSRAKDFVKFICLEALEETNALFKKAAGIIMYHCIKNKLISKEDFLSGVSELLNNPDIQLDNPLISTYIAEIVVETYIKEVVTFEDIAFVASSLKQSPISAKFFADLVNLIIKNKGAAWVEQKWIQSPVKLSDIIRKEDVYDFAKKHKLEFLLVKTELGRMLSAKASFDEITAWITKYVGEEKRKEPSFIRTLMTILLEASVTSQSAGFYKFDTDFFSNYEQLIVRYTNHSEELELPCLFAIQAFVHKLEYPQAIVQTIFNHLWDSCLIALESFKLWRDSKDPHEQEGHAVCVKSLTSFFTLLNEADTDDES